jgi:putative ABC transport system ATP-binding protein
VIRLANVSKVYNGAGTKVAALREVSLEIPRGAFVALMGPSGCGKSTLLNLIGGVDLPSGGEVWVDGRQLSRLDDGALSAFRRDCVGIVYQFYNLLPTMTAWENVALPALLAGASPRVAHGRAEACLDQVGLSHRKAHWPHELSGGEMQRVAIARALVNAPPLLLADEPTGNLESASGKEILELIQGLNHTQGVTILLATHSAEAAGYCRQVVRMRDGVIASASEGVGGEVVA